MIIHSTLQPPFCQRTSYSHETQVIRNTSETQKYTQKYKQSLRLPRAHSTGRLPASDYNKYYIQPQLRYRKKSLDPKKQLGNLQDEQFLYNNLHNPRFHHWHHPFQQPTAIAPSPAHLPPEDQLNRLLKFKKYVEHTKKGRLPIVVSECIARLASN